MATSTNPEIINGHDLTNSEWSYSKPKVNAKGGKNVGLRNNNTKKNLYISTPLMLTWGVNVYTDEKTGAKSYDMALQFPRDTDSNYSDATEKFLKGLVALEDQIKADAINNSKEWFNKPKMTHDVVDALWTPMLKYPKDPTTDEADKTRAPSLKVKIPCYEGVFNCELYDPTGEALFTPGTDSEDTPVTLIQKGQNVALLIESGGIWFANGKFGITWKLVQSVLQPKTGLRGKCHINIDPSTKARLESEALESSSDTKEEFGVVVADSEDDEEEEEDDHEGVTNMVDTVKKEVVAEVQSAPPVKKVVKRGRKGKAEGAE